MAKTNKKHNKQIKEFFHGASFEEGIVNLSNEQLKTLASLFDTGETIQEREALIKFLRRVWSGRDIAPKREIVKFISNNGLNKKDEEEHIEKLEKIKYGLESIEHTKEEAGKILELFSDTKNRKITQKKVLSKLNYLRKKEYFKSIEEAIDAEITTLDELSWYHSFDFGDFHKILHCKTVPLAQEIFDLPKDATIKKLSEIKKEVTAQKQKEIDAFLLTSKSNDYLSADTITEALSIMSPEVEIYHTPIPDDILEKIIQDINKKYYLISSEDHYIIEKEKKLLFHGRDLYYNISVSYTKEFIYKTIWQNKPLPIANELEDVNEKLLEDLSIAMQEMKDDMLDVASGLKINEEPIIDFIMEYFEPQVISSHSLKLKEKTKRRIMYHWQEYLKPFKERQNREELLAKTIRDFKLLFPLARSLKREIVFNVGPTNSGKTYAALKELKDATTGYYLAPLRLLALEGYEALKSDGVKVSLITGEEEIIDEDSTHVSSTIEMMNSQVAVDVCVIDEIQMINDRDRGWAWANALIGIPAKKVILTGSSDAIEAIKELCNYLGETLTIKPFERKNPLEPLEHSTSINQIEKQSAVIAFSRREVLALKQQLSEKYRVSVVYGNLSPEVRREEARRFREGESDILVATDAIAMGLNLPIKTILFAKDNKFDGLRRRELQPSEVLQISGRAGRYGIEEKGYVGALDRGILDNIKKALTTPLEDIPLPVSVMASLEHVMLIGEILDTHNLTSILEFFTENMEFDGPFVAANIDSMIEIANIVDEYKIDLQTRYRLACAPASISSPYIESIMHKYIRLIEQNKEVHYIPPKDLPKFAQTNEMLLNAEDRVREISLYLWLSFRFPDFFKDTELAISSRARLNNFIEHSLKEGHFVKECRRCGKVLDFSYRFSICDECHAKGKRGERFYKKKYR
jgi:ATP-dependent RNA helicase SUPV3L1/SUV3